MKIGATLRGLRTKANMSQGDLAKELNITQAYLSRVETDHKEASTDLIKRIGDYFKVPYAIVLWGAVEESDVAEEKKEIFKNLKPLVDSLINQLL